MLRNQLIQVLLVEPKKPAREIFISNTLEALQGTVGGYIETVSFLPDAVIICDEEGKLKGLPLNRSLYNFNGKPVDVIYGTFIVAGVEGENFKSLSPETLRKVKAMFLKPEEFGVFT